MTRILIVGEGPHDIGRREWSPRAGGYETTEGWLQSMVRRLRRSAGSEEGIRLRDLVKLPGKGREEPAGLAFKAKLAKFKAMSDGFDAVVLATDADSVDRAVHARKVRDIEAGFEAVPGAVFGVACVPMGTSEAWLLADANAWTNVAVTNRSGLPRRPEEIWGRPHDPASDHPKCVFARICEASGAADNTTTRASLAEACALEELERSCPISFPPFATQVSEI
jgi:hypothetical protein